MTFGAGTTATEVIEGTDLTGKVAVITGASGGIGLETARALASAGATVVLGNRNPTKAAAAAADLRASVPDAIVELGDLDLSSLASVRRFAAWVTGKYDSIDLLVNNAGVMAPPLERTSDGFELQFGTNHVAHFLLTNLLMPLLVEAGDARVVNLSSAGHFMGAMNWDDPNYLSSDYSNWTAYGQSKTANILFTIELERRVADSGVHAFAVHPGVVATDLGRHLGDEDRAMVERTTAKRQLLLKSPAQGAATTVLAATAGDVPGGSYLDDCQVSTVVAKHAQDPADGRRLWALTEELVGQTFLA